MADLGLLSPTPSASAPGGLLSNLDPEALAAIQAAAQGQLNAPQGQAGQLPQPGAGPQAAPGPTSMFPPAGGQQGGILGPAMDPQALQGLLAQNNVAQGALSAAMQPPPQTQAQPAPQGAGQVPGQGQGQGGMPQQPPQLPTFDAGNWVANFFDNLIGHPFQSTRYNAYKAALQARNDAQAYQMQAMKMKGLGAALGAVNSYGAPQLPAPGDAPSAATSPGSSAAAGGPPPTAPTLYTPALRRSLANLSLVDDKPADAAKILRDDVAKGTDGFLYDKNTGEVRGRLPDHAVVNGYNLDLGAPNAPNYVPKLPDGTMPNGNGGVIPIPGVVKATQDLARATSSGTAEGIAANDLVTITRPDGSTMQVPRSVAIRVAAANGGVAGTAPSPAAAGFSNDQAKGASDMITSLAGEREGAIQSRQSALTAKQYALTHPMNPGAPLGATVAGYLRALPPETLSTLGIDPQKVDQQATDANIFNRIANLRTLQYGKTLLPSRYTERELMLTKPIAGSLSTPNEAAAYGAAMDASLANRVQAQSDFVNGYSQTPEFKASPSRAGLEQAWANSAAGKRSIFQDPEAWKGVTINGKPAVRYVQVGGKPVGVFGYGTPFQYKFAVQP